MTIIGIGIDLVENARIEASIARHGERFLERVFTAAEREYCGKMSTPVPFYAARFAAKEAIAKAFGTGISAGVNFTDLEVRRKASGEPFVVLHGAAIDLAKRLEIVEWKLSLSHSEHYAIAQAMALGPAT